MNITGENLNGTSNGISEYSHYESESSTGLLNGTLNGSDSYSYEYDPEPPAEPWCNALCVFLLVCNINIFILGIVGNGIVIWIISMKTKRSVNSTWYLSLAVSDFLFCTTLPFNTVYMATGGWPFGHFMCKFIIAVVPLNMYSSIFLLMIISMDRCMCVVFPVWTQNNRTLRRSSAVIILVWLLSALLVLPYVIVFTTHTEGEITKCAHNSTAFSHENMVLIGFVFGLAIPLIVIVICYSVIMMRLRANLVMRNKSSKPFKLMTAVIIMFVVCWLPYQILRLMNINHFVYSPALLKNGIQITATLAFANSIVNPILYSFMGQDFRNKCLKSIFSRMENALHDETQSTRGMSLSKSGEIML